MRLAWVPDATARRWKEAKKLRQAANKLYWEVTEYSAANGARNVRNPRFTMDEYNAVVELKNRLYARAEALEVDKS